MANIFQRTMTALRRGRRFVTHDIWHVGTPGEEVPHGLIIKQVRVAILLVKGLVQDVLLVRAGALTFATLLAIVPLLALMFFVIHTFNIEQELYELMAGSATRQHQPAGDAYTPPMPEIDSLSGQAIAPSGPSAPSEPDTPATGKMASAPAEPSFKKDLVAMLFQGVVQQGERANGDDYVDPVDFIVSTAEKVANPSGDAKRLGLASVVFLLITVFGLMMNIENSFNSIWGLKRTRSWYRMFADYTMIVIFLPFLVAAALGATAVLEFRLTNTPALGQYSFLLRGVRYLVVWMGFSSLYFIVPNTRVKIRYALLGGLVATILWILASVAYFRSQDVLFNYDRVYGAAALLPLLAMWVFASWVIMLFGAELSFAYQNEKTFAMERIAENASFAYREALGVGVMLELGRRFELGAPPLSVSEAAQDWNVPTRLLGDTLDTLEDARLVIQCAAVPSTYQPARSVTRITIGDVVRTLRESGRDPSALRDDETLRPYLEALFKPDEGYMNHTVADLAAELGPPKPPELPLEEEPDVAVLPDDEDDEDIDF